MEDESEVQAYQQQEPAPAQEDKHKKKKAVGFALDQNQVKEFDKTQRIMETPNQSEHEKKSL